MVAAVFIGFAFNASRIRDLLERRRQYRELRDNHHSQTSTSSVSFNNQPQRRRGTLVARIAERCKSRWEHLAGRIKKQHEDAHDIEKQPVVGVKNPQHATQITAKGTVVETKSSSRSSTNRNEP